jgi:hypothetical protein
LWRCRPSAPPGPVPHPGLDAIEEPNQGQPKTHTAGIDVIYADVLDSARTPTPIPHHRYALVFLVSTPIRGQASRTD